MLLGQLNGLVLLRASLFRVLMIGFNPCVGRAQLDFLPRAQLKLPRGETSQLARGPQPEPGYFFQEVHIFHVGMHA